MKCAFCGIEISVSNGVVWKETHPGSKIRRVLAWHAQFDDSTTGQKNGLHCWTFDREVSLPIDLLILRVNERGEGRIGTEAP